MKLADELNSLPKEQIPSLLAALNPEQMALIISHAAKSGIHSNQCLKADALAMQVHFYSPIPDVADLLERKVLDRTSPMTGVPWDIDKYRQNLEKICQSYGQECKWPQTTYRPFEFHTDNNSFSFACAAITHSMIRHYKPKRIIEIGSGKSSRVIAKAAILNKRDDSQKACDYQIVDPFPDFNLQTGMPGVSKINISKVELLESEFFDQLQENDILFIDSGHVVKTGADVNYLFLDILPRLKKGVIIHIHDISIPREYPETYFTSETFRMFWTEGYLLQAFLAFNDTFRTLLPLGALAMDDEYWINAFQKHFPHFNREIHSIGSGSYWIKRVK